MATVIETIELAKVQEAPGGTWSQRVRSGRFRVCFPRAERSWKELDDQDVIRDLDTTYFLNQIYKICTKFVSFTYNLHK